MKTRIKFFFALTLLVLTQAAPAHYPRESYIYLTVDDSRMFGRFEMTLEDLAKAIPIDVDGDGTVSLEEFDARRQTAYDYLKARLRFFDGEQAHAVTITGHRSVKTEVGTFVLMDFDLPTLGAPPESLDIDFEVPLEGIDAQHKSRLIIENNSRTGVADNESVHALLLEHGGSRQTFSLVGLPWTDIFGRFLFEGAWHIWIGLDHILFLVALLLVAVVTRDDKTSRQWQPVSNFRSALIYVVKVVTVFTVAHTLTLCLATLGVLRLPVTPVEVVIALSIAVAAWNNLRPLLKGKVWLVVFGFGLIHGFGFANVLMPLGLSTSSLVLGLAGFNIGVELGQIAIVMLIFPVLYSLRGWRGYEPIVIRGGSIALIAVAAFWVAERSIGWVLKQDMLARALTVGVG